MTGKCEEKLGTILKELEEVVPDAGRHDRGQTAGGTRLRKTATKMQDALQDLKRQVLEDRKSR